MPGHADGGLLDDFIGFRVGQSGLDGEVARQLAVNPVKLLPALHVIALLEAVEQARPPQGGDRKSTRLNSSHTVISYAVFCLKKKKTGTLAISYTISPVISAS